MKIWRTKANIKKRFVRANVLPVKMFHYTCLGEWFAKCASEPKCPMCNTVWKYTDDVEYLKSVGERIIAYEEER